jgi:hypothetical protein
LRRRLSDGEQFHDALPDNLATERLDYGLGFRARNRAANGLFDRALNLMNIVVASKARHCRIGWHLIFQSGDLPI